jgi:hypothetical protein
MKVLKKLRHQCVVTPVPLATAWEAIREQLPVITAKPRRSRR